MFASLSAGVQTVSLTERPQHLMDGLATKGLCTRQASLTLREQTRAERVPTCQMEKMPWLCTGSQLLGWGKDAMWPVCREGVEPAGPRGPSGRGSGVSTEWPEGPQAWSLWLPCRARCSWLWPGASWAPLLSTPFPTVSASWPHNPTSWLVHPCLSAQLVHLLYLKKRAGAGGQ